MTISWRDFEAIDMRVGVVVNFPSKQIGSFVSAVLVLGAYTEAGAVVLLRPDVSVAAGSRIG